VKKTYMPTTEYYLDLKKKKKEILPFVTTWRDNEHVNEKSLSREDKYYMITFL
jgi:hypothetical protein